MSLRIPGTRTKILILLVPCFINSSFGQPKVEALKTYEMRNHLVFGLCTNILFEVQDWDQQLQGA
jgi:hypothetical protein